MTTLAVRLFPLALFALAGCTGEAVDSTDTDPSHTGDSDSAVVDDTAGCLAGVTSTEPADGTTGVYYHDTLTVSFDGDGGDAVFTLADDAGVEVPVSATWTDGNVQAILTPAAMAPLTTYTLTTTVCGTTATSSFTTSDLGTPLTVDPSDLVGSTYVFRLSDADITEPAFLGIIAGTYLTVPILIGVDQADSETIDLIGGLGYEQDAGYVQEPGLPTWDFPVASFADQPYFEAASSLITIMYGTTPIPISDFTLSGTFRSDGSAIEHGIATGTGDSRYMAELVGKPADEYSAVCDLAASAGVVCTECPTDGEPYCLYIVAESINATKVDGLTMDAIE